MVCRNVAVIHRPQNGSKRYSCVRVNQNFLKGRPPLMKKADQKFTELHRRLYGYLSHFFFFFWHAQHASIVVKLTSTQKCVSSYSAVIRSVEGGVPYSEVTTRLLLNRNKQQKNFNQVLGFCFPPPPLRKLIRHFRSCVSRCFLAVSAWKSFHEK